MFVNALENEFSKLKAARSGDQEAANEIILFYEPEIRRIASKYFLQRADFDDLIQEGRIAIYKAILAFDLDSDIPFLHFVRMVIKRKIIDSLRAHNRHKHLKFNEAYSLNNSLSDDQEDSFLDLITNVVDPETTVIALDEVRTFVKDLTDGFSKLELVVFQYHFVAGFKQREVSQRLGLNPKSLDNAIQRIRRKTQLYRSRQEVG
ncbi:MAG: sigma-70 family RNA polymerase sigma factor [Desulfitobacterium hafniense]|nr:sigma-70 family RNA polymerase sigma factor [Desulfitobacterium hafniense]